MNSLGEALRFRFGLNPLRYVSGGVHLVNPPDFSETCRSTIKAVHSYTMTSPERINALIEAVRFIVERNVPGDLVECGVWRGGTMMAAARTLLELNAAPRHLFLFDTFEGMPKPSELDVDIKGRAAGRFFHRARTNEDASDYCRATLDEVRAAMNSTHYDPAHVHLVKGKVEETIPANSPNSIALLRLDTDWYESTKHELVHLFPRLSIGGILIIDDYGHWQGARKAVDEYFGESGRSIFLSRIDYTGRIGVKVS